MSALLRLPCRLWLRMAWLLLSTGSVGVIGREQLTDQIPQQPGGPAGLNSFLETQQKSGANCVGVIGFYVMQPCHPRRCIADWVGVSRWLGCSSGSTEYTMRGPLCTTHGPSLYLSQTSRTHQTWDTRHGLRLRAIFDAFKRGAARLIQPDHHSAHAAILRESWHMQSRHRDKMS